LKDKAKPQYMGFVCHFYLKTIKWGIGW